MDGGRIEKNHGGIKWQPIQGSVGQLIFLHIFPSHPLHSPLDPDRHQQRVDVKAVTLHQFHLEKTNGGWIAQVILDI